MGSLDAGANPVVIQGGMGVAVSGWRLARSVGCLGQLGVVSGTALDVVHAHKKVPAGRLEPPGLRALAGRSGVWSAADVVRYLLAGTNLA